jgi:hypothetical protein
MSFSSRRVSDPAKMAGSPPKEDANPPKTSPPEKMAEDHDTNAPTSAIDIPQAQTATKPDRNFPAGWLHSSKGGGNKNGKSGFSIPVGRPKTPRNRRGLTITTARPNPLLDPRPASASPTKSKSSSNMGTPAESPTTPNSRMIFPLEINQWDGVVEVFGGGGGMEREREKSGEEK